MGRFPCNAVNGITLIQRWNFRHGVNVPQMLARQSAQSIDPNQESCRFVAPPPVNEGP
jgi:hypothetical protein